jgi:hypothetical protein
MWRVVLAGVVLAIVGGAFVAGRSSRPADSPPDPVRLEDGVPVGGLETPGGALAAADNFVSTGVTASIEPRQLRRFVNAVVDPRARDSFIVDNPAPGSGPPPGARVTASVVAHRLVAYGAGGARVSMWVVAAYWGGGAVPTQYWSLVQLSLRWSGDRWRIVSGQDSLPGPVPALIAGRTEDRAVELWDQALAGMSAPYYGTVEDG